MKRTDVENGIRIFAKQIAGPSTNLGMVDYAPVEGMRPNDCMANVLTQIGRVKGYFCPGWYFGLREADCGFYLVATNHFVWQPPSSIFAVDITPFVDDERLHPYLAGPNSILFFSDLSATAVTSKAMTAPRPSKYYPLEGTPELRQYVREKQEREWKDWTMQYGMRLPE
jgi:hypothetical protein